MSQIITTGSFPKDLFPGVFRWFGQAYEQEPKEWPDLFDTETSSLAYEEVVEAVPFGLAQVKPETESISYDTSSQGYTSRFTHATFALGFMISMEAMQDGQAAKNGHRRARDLGFSMRTTHELVAAEKWNDSFTANGGDGVPQFSASHPTAAGLQSNLLTPADLSEAALEDAAIAATQIKDSRGKLIGLKAISLHVASANSFEAVRILKSILQNDTANNAINALRASGEFPGGIKVNRRFDDSDAWFVRTNLARGTGPVHFQRMPLEFDDDGSFDSKTTKFSAVERWSCGFADWRCALGNAGA